VPCDKWRAEVRPHERLERLLPRVEPVEWLYDGLNGKVIAWTKENGGTSDDPSVQVFLCAGDGRVFARCPDSGAYSASGLAGWLEEQLLAYEKLHPRTAVAFLPAELTGDEKRCEALDSAREAATPVLLYFAREERDADDKRAKAEWRACRAFEKGAFMSKKTAEDAAGWLLLRFDLADETHAAYALALGVKGAPALWMIVPGGEKPVDLGTKLKAANLSYHLKKFKPATASTPGG